MAAFDRGFFRGFAWGATLVAIVAIPLVWFKVLPAYYAGVFPAIMLWSWSLYFRSKKG